MALARRGLYIKQSFTNDFVEVIEEIEEKYGEKVFEIQGIATEHTDLVQFSRSFFSKSASNVADVSVDANANVREKTMLHYNQEAGKALKKLNSLYLMYKWIKKYYHSDVAAEALEKVVTGELFINDLVSFDSPYCYAFDLRNLMERGMNFFHGNMPIKAPKRSDSFIALMIQTTAYISNQILGASSYPDFFVALDWYYRKEMGDDYTKKMSDPNVWYKMKNQFQNLIYSLNFPFRGSQSLRGDERIIVNGRPIEIANFVEDNLPEGEESAPITDCWTYSLNCETGRMEKKTVKGVIRHKLDDDHLVEYKTALGQKFAGTRGHSLFTRKGLDIKLITAESEVDNILIPFNFCKETKVTTLDVPNVGGTIPVEKLILTPEIMYLIGQYVGDGSAYGSRLEVCTHGNKVANDHIINSVGDIFKTHIDKQGNVEISVGKNVNTMLKELIGHGSRNKDIPRDWYDEENILYLIGGYIDADGHARTEKGSIVISSTNRGLLESVQFVLLGRGIIAKIGEHDREGFGVVSTIYRLTIPAVHASILNKYLVIKKVPEKTRLDYSRQVFDFDGVYQILMKEYNIRGLAQHGVVDDRSRDKSMSLEDMQNVVGWLQWVIKQEELVDDDCEYMETSLSPKYRDGDYTQQVVIAKKTRVVELRECLAKLKVFMEAAPVRIDEIVEVEAEEYVYDISVEGNENFVTADNLYAHNSPFVNLSIMDKGFMKELFSGYVYPDFSKPDIDSSLALSKRFFEYFVDVNGKEGIFTFPIMTLAISLDDEDEYIDPEFVDWSAEVNAEKSTANIFQSTPNAFSSCCRLKNEFKKVADTGYQNSFGVGGLAIGSHRVAGLNLPRIAKLEKDDPGVMDRDIELLHKILLSHRRLIKHRIDGGYMPLYDTGWIHLNRQYSTVGFVGGYEYVVNKGLDIKTEEGIVCLRDVLQKIEGHIKTWQEAEQEEGNIYNVEQIPAESMAVRLAELDKLLGYNKRWKLYSNQYIPLVEDASIYDRFRIQGAIDAHTSGGAILHLNVDDEKPLSPKQFRRIMEHARKSGTVYFAVNYAYSECANSHYSVGKHDVCKVCNSEIVAQYTRVVGFLTPVRSWNKVRRDYEYENRVFYDNKNVSLGAALDPDEHSVDPKKQVVEVG